jgi:hypothetical protein
VLVVFGSSTVAFGPQSSVPRRNQFVVVAAATKAENPLTATDLTEEQVGVSINGPGCFGFGCCSLGPTFHSMNFLVPLFFETFYIGSDILLWGI